MKTQMKEKITETFAVVSLTISLFAIALPATAETGKVTFIAIYENAPAFKPVRWLLNRVDGYGDVIKKEQFSFALNLNAGKYHADLVCPYGQHRQRFFEVGVGVQSTVAITCDSTLN